MNHSLCPPDNEMPEHLCQDNLFWRQSRGTGKGKGQHLSHVCSGRLALWGRKNSGWPGGVAGSELSTGPWILLPEPRTCGMGIQALGLIGPGRVGSSTRQGEGDPAPPVSSLFFLSGAACLQAKLESCPRAPRWHQGL